MLLDLAQLRDMHPRLPSDLALLIMTRAALGLQRNGHTPGIEISLEIERLSTRGLLAWPVADLDKLDQHDQRRITEDGAEAIALALVHQNRGWRVVRRMQQEEHGDWLLEQLAENQRQVVALEVSGIDRGSIGQRLNEKLRQVSQSTDVDQQWAGVVGFEEPAMALGSTRGESHGH